MKRNVSSTPRFNQISANEWKLKFKDEQFILKEKPAGVYGIGRAAFLYHLQGFKASFMKKIAWTKSDNHSPDFKTCHLTGIVTIEEAKAGAIEYLTRLSE